MRAGKLLPPLLVAALLRFSGLAWDGWHHQHPDERFLVMVAERLSFPESLGQALDPSRTPLNPQNEGFGFYVYGTLFPTLNLASAKLLGLAHYTGLLQTGRALAALFDCLTLVLLASTAARLANPAVGTWIAWIYAFTGLALQHARFGTADALALSCVAFTLFAALREVSPKQALLAGMGVGLAAASRPNLATLGLPVALAVLLLPLARPGHRPWVRRLGYLLLAGATALFLWKLLDPGFFASTLSPWPNPRRLANFRELAANMRGDGQYPPNLQWAGRGPLFFFWNLFFWGLGPALGFAVLWALTRTFPRLFLKERNAWVLFAWLVPSLSFQATRFVVSFRHALPTLPFLFLALALAGRHWNPKRWASLLALTVPWGLAWAAFAWQPYTRLQASAFLRERFPQGTVVAVEAWDDGLPIDYGAEQFAYRELPVYAPDTQEKRQQLLHILDEVQVIVLSSQRGVGSVCRVPDAYPVMSEFYHLLFQGQLGFDTVFAEERKFGWGRWGLSQLGAEEAFSVYDHPPVWIFAKNASYDPEKARALLGRVRLPERTDWQTRELEARGRPPYQVARLPMLPSPPTWSHLWSGQLLSLGLWVALVELLGLAATALLHLWLGLPRQPAALLARPLAMLFLGMLVLWGGTLGLPGWRGPLWTGALLALAIVFRKPMGSLAGSREVRFARVLFYATFALFLLVRAWNPEIYWGEKPMDAAIFNVLLRTQSLPPPDPWFFGYPINYYFFGFLPFVALRVCSFAPASVAFNLAAATVPALTFVAAAAAGWFLGRARGAVLAGFLAQASGTAFLLFHPTYALSPNFDRFWASSRVIPEGINEYPVWTALFADLHAHFLSFSGFCSALAVLLAFVTQSITPRTAAWLGGLLLATQYMSNTWEIPALLFLTALAAFCRFAFSPRALPHVLGFLAKVGLLALTLSLPYLVTQQQLKGGLFWERGQPLQLAQVLELYGVHGGCFLLAAIAGFAGLRSWRARSFVAGAGLLAFAFVLLPPYFTLVDKMNTYFKLGLQAFLILGVLAGGLAGAASPTAGRWLEKAVRGSLALLAFVGLAGAVWCAWAVMTTRRVPGPRPTLDGEAYLEYFQPQLAQALPRLRRSPLRAVAETASPSYADNLRISMFAGLPAVTGWDYHLWQRGKSQAEIRLRFADLETLLRGTPEDLATALAARWHVDVIARWDKPLEPRPGFRPIADGNQAVLCRGEP